MLPILERCWLTALRRMHPGKDRALFDAVCRRDVRAVSSWLAAGADPEVGFDLVRPVATRLRQSALLAAIECHDASLVRLLLHAGASPGRSNTGMDLPMTQWLLTLARIPQPTPEHEQVGLALMEAGADLEKGMRAMKTLSGVLVGLGHMPLVDRLEKQARASKDHQSLDQETHPVPMRPRRRGL